MKSIAIFRRMSFVLALALLAGKATAEPTREELLQQLKEIRSTLADDKTESSAKVELAIAALDKTIGNLKEEGATVTDQPGGSVLSKSVQDQSGHNMDSRVFGMPGVPDWGADHFQQMQQMRQMMDRMMEDQMRLFDNGPSGLPGSASLVRPNADIAEEGDNYVVRIDLPGADKDKIQVDVRGRVLRINGERNQEIREEGADGHVIRQERRVGSFQRTIPLPGPVKDDKVQAKYENGVLVVTLPKAGDADNQGRTITVQ